MLEAKEKGFPVPGNVLTDLFRHLRSIANKTPESYWEARNAAFATYVLTRSGIVTTQYLTDIRGWFDNYEKTRPEIRAGIAYENWRKDISALYLAATYQLLKDENEAKALLKDVGLVEPVVPDYSHYYDRFIHGSIYLYIASHHFPDRVKGISPTTILNYLEPLTQGYYSTISGAYALLALDGYMKVIGSQSTGPIAASLISASGEEQSIVLPPDNLFPKFKLWDAAEKLKLTSPGILYYQLYQEGYDKVLPTETVKEGLEVYREFQNDSGQSITETRLGEKVTVVLRMRAVGRDSLDNAVIVDMLPGGFEVEMSGARFNSGSTSGEANSDTTGASQSQPIFGFGLPGYNFLPDYADVREDRVLLFGTVPNNDTAEFRYRLTPTNKGSFIVPPIFGEGMYDRSVTAVAPGGRIKTDAPAEVKP